MLRFRNSFYLRFRIDVGEEYVVVFYRLMRVSVKSGVVYIYVVVNG